MLIREMIREVDTDPANNPGRPADAYDYVGMRPKATWAMSHPSLDGGAAAGAGGEAGSESEGGAEGGELGVPDGEPTEEA